MEWLSAFALAWTIGLIVPAAPGGIGVFEAAFSDAKISMREIFKNQDEKCRVDELNRFKSKIDQYLLNECIKSENSWTQLIHDVCCAVFIVPLFIRRIEENVFGLLKDQSIFARRTYHQTLLDDCVKVIAAHLV